MRALALAALALVLAACGHQGSGPSSPDPIDAKAKHRAERFCADPDLVGEALDARAYLDCVDHYAAVFAANMRENADR